jgi:hypothetical protein
LRVFREYGFNPIVVFDGAPPGSKENTNARRQAKRAEKKAMYDASVRNNAPDPKFLVDAFDIHGYARLLLIAAMQVNNFDFIQAPYEADTQIIQCWRENQDTSAIVTCDSDVLMFFNPGMKIIYWGPQHPGVNFENPLQWAYYAPFNYPVPAEAQKPIKISSDKSVPGTTWWDMLHEGKRACCKFTCIEKSLRSIYPCQLSEYLCGVPRGLFCSVGGVGTGAKHNAAFICPQFGKILVEVVQSQVQLIAGAVVRGLYFPDLVGGSLDNTLGLETANSRGVQRH